MISLLSIFQFSGVVENSEFYITQLTENKSIKYCWQKMPTSLLPTME